MKEIITDITKLPSEPGVVLETNTRDKKLNQVMRDTVVELKRLIREKNLDGLTACQIGVNERIMVLNFGNDDLRTYINPLLIHADGFVLNRERCIHLPNQEFLVPRNKEITLMFETPLGAVQQAKFIGKAAYVAQHLIWHMDGLFIDEVGLEIDDDWDKMTDDEKAEIVKQYCESVDRQSAELNDEIKQSEEAQKLKDAIEFEQALSKGEVKIREEKFTIENEERNEDTAVQEEQSEPNVQ